MSSVVETMPRLICVYCSSSDRLDDKYYKVAACFGQQLVAHGWGLVYGGGNRGAMGVLGRAVKEAGGYVVGVIPGFMKSRELALDDASELITVATMRERKQLMEERAAGFVTLPGGIGTLEEFTEVMTLRYLNLLHKPVIATYHTLFEEYLQHYIPWLRAAWLRGLARRFSRGQCNDLDAVIVPSSAMRKRLRIHKMQHNVRDRVNQHTVLSIFQLDKLLK